MSLQASGKIYEARIAKILRGRHIKRSSYGEAAPDVEHDHLVVEVKLRKELALENWMQQVEKHAEPGKLTVVISKQKHLDDSKSIVSLRIDDFLGLIS